MFIIFGVNELKAAYILIKYTLKRATVMIEYPIETTCCSLNTISFQFRSIDRTDPSHTILPS